MKATYERAVLVTGASTGIGRVITEHLAASGYFVFAGARKDVDLAALNEIDHVQAVRLDITRAEDIENAKRTLDKSGKPLFALINNAGVLTSGLLDTTDTDEFELTMRVNVYGTWQVTRALVPALKSSRGRVLTIGSVNGFAVIAGYGAYCMSKHALEAFADALATELESAGIRVSIVEPGNYASSLMKNELERGRSSALNSDYVSAGADPSEVAVTVLRSLSDETPRRRYLIAPNEVEARFTLESHVQRLIELNDGHAYSMNREALLQMVGSAFDRMQQGIAFKHEWPGEISLQKAL